MDKEAQKKLIEIRDSLTSPQKEKKLLIEFNAQKTIDLLAEEVRVNLNKILQEFISSTAGFEQSDGTFCLFNYSYNSIKDTANSKEIMPIHTIFATKILGKFIQSIE